MVQEMRTPQTCRGPQHAMCANPPRSRRSLLHLVIPDFTPDLSDPPNLVYQFPVDVASNPCTSGPRDISLEDPLDADAGAEGAVRCTISCRGG
jgi:hypothetical protein